MLAMTRRPSPTTPGSVANEPSMRTSWATEREAGASGADGDTDVASLRASTSLTPSPVIATTWPLDCRALTISTLLVRRHPAEHGAGLYLVGQFVRVLGKVASIDDVADPGTPTSRAMAATVSG